ncbi:MULTISPECIES: N-formylglutamate amidohydrolase [Sulfitobacter]|jgi:predicted N-formylglutamate amidohydrolase|uniref:N-formylglutamate amidohydrolase n=1 Tax=Sulfitobacter profundi TaxID=2679961 RepID=A0ABW1Z2H1_9RHOB|nr:MULTISPECIES: N-formylglutamate amidohydrolase [Sulfitobacter]AYE88092.1 N-formylglutamate amidohydrolase [Sulfitobacter sp. D7]MBO9432201.1 N-formylglutamate amidohydrolase [Sulfitobacter sp. R18_1]MCZ4368368.1 N-formylglutamate amidohydrolase [Sulfitobacter dubius]|tara:strand:+ start:955 stop:1722 length:768 start_codon:yes stop_codon:yes gene_type:complete
MTLDTTRPLLGADDPAPVTVLNPDSNHPVLLVCEHAGRAVPQALNGLGMKADDRDSHVGWDIGAEAVTRLMAETLNAPAVLQSYSRLVIDCNRPPEAPDAIPESNHGVSVPGNRALDNAARVARVREIFEPFQEKVAEYLRQPSRRMVLAIHSFTPTLGKTSRPWEIGFLFRHETHASTHLARLVQEARPELTIGMNEPYQIDDESDWFVPQHGEASGLPHSLIEIRNDQIRDSQGRAAWAETLSTAINRYLKEV